MGRQDRQAIAAQPRAVNDGGFPALHVPAREVPVPAHLSPQAQAMLAHMRMSSPDWPPIGDKQAWRDLQAQMDGIGLPVLREIGNSFAGTFEEIDVGGAKVYAISPDGLADTGEVYLDLHGGSLIWGGGESCRAMGLVTADIVRARVWAVDYRLPPDHPYPAPLDDCLSVYRALLEQVPPEKVIIGGASAGGNLAAALILRARDEGLPLPVAAVLNTPELDLTETGDTFFTNLGVDTALVTGQMPANLVYADGHDLTDPYLSPLFGDFTRGFPPTFLQSGTRDLFLSNTVRMHRALRAADIEAELHVFEAATHIMFIGAPESEERTREMRLFVDRHWRR